MASVSGRRPSGSWELHCAEVLGRVRRTYRIVSRGNAAYLAGFSLVWFGAIVGFVIIGDRHAAIPLAVLHPA